MDIIHTGNLKLDSKICIFYTANPQDRFIGGHILVERLKDEFIKCIKDEKNLNRETEN